MHSYQSSQLIVMNVQINHVDSSLLNYAVSVCLFVLLCFVFFFFSFFFLNIFFHFGEGKLVGMLLFWFKCTQNNTSSYRYNLLFKPLVCYDIIIIFDLFKVNFSIKIFKIGRLCKMYAFCARGKVVTVDCWRISSCILRKIHRHFI